MRNIVVMPGGFHPFHAGHAALYQSAVKAFNDADTYVAATNDTKTRPFPFAIKEKLAKLAGVADKHFVQVKSPFQPKEITSHYNPDEDVLIFVRSEKDKNESPKPGGTKKDGSPAYFQPWTGKDVQPFSQHAYIAYLPTVEFGPGITSATEIRNAWPKLDDRRKTAMVMSLYPVTQKNPKLAANVVKMLDMGMGENLNEILGFKISRIPTKSTTPTASLADMRKEFDKEKSLPKVIRNNDYDSKPKFIRTVTVDEDVPEEKVIDPELNKMLNFAKLHYPNSPNMQAAFMKYVQRALKHSEQDDREQDTKLDILDKEVDQLQRTVAQSTNVTESADYLEEK